jgi:hypothetical protein
MKNSSLRAILILLILPLLSGCKLPVDNQQSNTFPLEDVISTTRKAVDDYQGQVMAAKENGDTDALPDLASADFDFKTVVDTKGGPGASLLVFTAGVTREDQVTDDVDFLYKPRPKEAVGRFG